MVQHPYALVCGAAESDGAMSGVEQAKATILYNLATVFCVLKEHDKAKQSLQRVSSWPLNHTGLLYYPPLQAAALFTRKPPQLVLLSAYLELAKGEHVNDVIPLYTPGSMLCSHPLHVCAGNSSQALQIIRKTQPMLS
jgi:hypothetical protein